MKMQMTFSHYYDVSLTFFLAHPVYVLLLNDNRCYYVSTLTFSTMEVKNE